MEGLLVAPELAFDETLRSRLPDKPGIYVIYERDRSPLEPLHAGRTTAGGLRQRVYQNHLMGDQSGNLRAKLVNDGRCADSDQAKNWIRRNCLVKCLVIEDQEALLWAEHYMLSVLQPKYSS